MRKVLLSLLLIVLSCFIFSCQTENTDSISTTANESSAVSDSTSQKLLLYKKTCIFMDGTFYHSTTYDYDNFGRESKIIAESVEGIKIIKNSYDNNGNIIKKIETDDKSELKNLTEYIYNDNGKLISEVYSSSVVVNNKLYTYDSMGRICVVTTEGFTNKTETYTYKADGSYTVNDGKTTKTYNKDGFETESIADNTTIKSLYDENNNMINSKSYSGDKLIAEIIQVFDESNKIQKTEAFSNGKIYSTIVYEYDENGNLIKSTDIRTNEAEGSVINYEYKLFTVEGN